MKPFLIKIYLMLFGGIIDMLNVAVCKFWDKSGNQMLQCCNQALHFHNGQRVIELLHVGGVLRRDAVFAHDAADHRRGSGFGTERHKTEHGRMFLICDGDNQIVEAQNTF